MRTLTISRNSFYLRFFIWAWDANPEKLDFCKLFWGTLFLPLTLLKPSPPVYKSIPRLTVFYWLVALFFAIGYGEQGGAIWAVVWTAFGFLLWGIEHLKQKRKKQSRREESVWLDRVTDIGSRGFVVTGEAIRKVQPAVTLLKGLGRLLLSILRLIWWAIRSVLQIIWWLVSAVFFIPRIIWESVDFGRSRTLQRLGWRIGDFFYIVGEGIHAVKDRTCPVIKVT